MKPATMNRTADSVGISLNYKPEPNWLTYTKLQELADRVELELRSRGLNPHSRMDVQGFIWASIRIEERKAKPGKAATNVDVLRIDVAASGSVIESAVCVLPDYRLPRVVETPRCCVAQ